MADNDNWDDACHNCGAMRCGCTPEDLANLGDRVAASKRVFNADQVASLNAYQVAGVMHPFTCGHRDHSTELVAHPDGWYCPITKTKVQDWAHGFMADWSWTSMSPFGLIWDRENGKWR